MNSRNDRILRVHRTKAQARESYHKISRICDYFAGVVEKKHSNIALEQLDIKRGETVLEIGFGTGHCLKRIAESVGKDGKVYGIDVSSGMLEVEGDIPPLEQLRRPRGRGGQRHHRYRGQDDLKGGSPRISGA